MNIFINKNAQQTGPYSLEELNARLASEVISGEDLCWYEGCEDWMTVSQLPGFVPVPSKQEPPPLPKAQPTKKAQERTSTASSNAQWYYSHDDQKIGPHILDELVRLIRVNLLQPNVLVWHGGMMEWAPAYKTELSKYFDEAENRAANDTAPLTSSASFLTSESSKQVLQNENKKNRLSPWGAVALSNLKPFLRIAGILVVGYFAIKAAIEKVDRINKDGAAMTEVAQAYALRKGESLPENKNYALDYYNSVKDKIEKSVKSPGMTPEPEYAKSRSQAGAAVEDQPEQVRKLNPDSEKTSKFGNPTVELVRNGTMALDSTRTIGDALERNACFDKVSWRCFIDDNGRSIVEFSGECQKFLERLNQSLEFDPENIFQSKIYYILIGGEDALEHFVDAKKRGLTFRNASLVIKFALDKRVKNKFEIASESMRVEMAMPKVNNKVVAIDSDNDPFLGVVFQYLGGSRKQSLITKLYEGLSHDDFNLMTLCILYAKAIQVHNESEVIKTKANMSLPKSTPAASITTGTDAKTNSIPKSFTEFINLYIQHYVRDNVADTSKDFAQSCYYGDLKRNVTRDYIFRELSKLIEKYPKREYSNIKVTNIARVSDEVINASYVYDYFYGGTKIAKGTSKVNISVSNIAGAWQITSFSEQVDRR